MKVDLVMSGDLPAVEAAVRSATATDLDGLLVAETKHDPFLQLARAGVGLPRLQVGTGIAVAFARNPMTMASTAHDLQRYLEGRFLLGLGSQVSAHVTKRFSMPWSHPAARMGEYIAALKSIWLSWNSGQPLDFRGDFYTHTLMTPMFNPGPSAFGPPRVLLAAVGPQMSKVAGRYADGMMSHTFTTPRYLREVTMPSLLAGLQDAGRDRGDFEVSASVFVVTGADERQLQAAARAVRRQLGFYGSTPAYRRVLELHGWGDAHTELHALSRRGDWGAMADVFDDEMLRTFAVVGEPSTISTSIIERLGGMADRVSFAMPYGAGEQILPQIVSDLRAAWPQRQKKEGHDA